MNADVVIVGAGPAGIFTALELLRRGSPEKIVMIEQGQAIENRRCPKAKTGRCMNCKPYCHITTGFSGAGAFSDGKLSLCSDVGGDLPTLVGEQKAQELIDYADSIYLEFGADEHVEGLENTEEIKQIRTRAIRAGLRLVDSPLRHLGTEQAHLRAGLRELKVVHAHDLHALRVDNLLVEHVAGKQEFGRLQVRKTDFGGRRLKVYTRLVDTVDPFAPADHKRRLAGSAERERRHVRKNFAGSNAKIVHNAELFAIDVQDRQFEQLTQIIQWCSPS